MTIQQELLFLVMTLGPGTQKIHTILSHHPQIEGTAQSLRETLQENPFRLSDYQIRRIRETGEAQVEEMEQRCAEKEIGLLPYTDSRYPENLRASFNPPVILFYQGQTACLETDFLLTVVGTRKLAPYCLKMEQSICRRLLEYDFVFVTGFAVGADVAANLCALDAGKPSVGVLGCGVDYLYPAENRQTRERLIRSGLLLSEFLPGTAPGRNTFPMRNRILACISRGTFIVQAPLRSGALITAEAAVEHGNDVFCLPPHDLEDAQYLGVVRYLRDGAIGVYNADDIINEYVMSFPHLAGGYVDTLYDRTQQEAEKPKERKGRKDKRTSAQPEVPAQVQEAEETEETEKPEEPEDIQAVTEEELAAMPVKEAVLVYMKRAHEVQINRLASDLQRGIQQVMAALSELEIMGTVERLPGQVYRLLSDRHR